MINLDLILWMLGGGFTLNFALLALIWKSLREDVRTLREDIRTLREDVKDIDRRLCRLEGAFSSREWCGIRDSRIQEKAE